MPDSTNNISDMEQQLLTLQEEVDKLRVKNTDLTNCLKAYSLISSSQTSLINKLIDKVPFGVMLLNEQHNIIHANAAAGKIFSCDASEMKGQNCSHFFEGYEPPKSSSDDPVGLHKIRSLKNNKHVVHSAFVNDEGSEKIIVETFIDITEIKKAEQESLKTSKTKDEFLGMISHELRTPLNVIQGYSSLLNDELGHKKSKEAASYLAKINSASEALLRLVNNLLELSDLTAGKVKADNIPIGLEMIITQLQYRFEKDFEDSGNKLLFKYENIEPFEQDLALLMKALYELMFNANKFTEDGVVTLSVLLQERDGIDWLCFKISDTGCGMTESTIAQVFNAFHQIDSSLTRSYEGLGLGLSLVEKIVTIINGHIEVESEFEKGTTFSIFLPYQRAQ